nr:RNA-directed DNA polymerase, eukaryota, reverse transcriptase zinc-binding domain protein [Tanacetum cinerariifolium]
MFFESMKEEDKIAVSFVLPFAVRKLPMRYLGVPLIAKRLGVKDCRCLLDKIKNKIQNGRIRLGHFFQYLTNKDLYDERLDEDLKVNDMIFNGRWRWPDEWYEKFPLITSLEVPDIEKEREVKIVWMTKLGKK